MSSVGRAFRSSVKDKIEARQLAVGSGFTINSEVSLYESVGRLHNIAQSAISGDDAQIEQNAAEYSSLRRTLLTDKEINGSIPKIILDNASLMGLSLSLRDKRSSLDGRMNYLSSAFGSLQGHALTVDSSRWTGIQSRAERLTAIRGVLPLALDAVESLLSSLQKVGENGGPPLEERAEAIEILKDLHRVLGQLLSEIEAGRFTEHLGNGLISEAVEYAKRVAVVLQGDPIPYTVSALLLGIFSMCGFPGTGGLTSAVALSFTKRR